MPVISKKRLNLGIAVHHGGPDIAMLFLAMRLIISPPGEEAEFLYELSKNFLATLESAGVVSYLCLQALLLVALYEYSQAIYPAAWVRVGVCTRYVELLGISCSASRNIEIRQSVGEISLVVYTVELTLACRQHGQKSKKGGGYGGEFSFLIESSALAIGGTFVFRGRSTMGYCQLTIKHG
jgi:hypothetical protein